MALVFRLCRGNLPNNGRINWNGKDAIDELNNQTPLPMNTMLDKQPREEAIAKKRRRDAMQLANVPPTNPGNPQ